MPKTQPHRSRECRGAEQLKSWLSAAALGQERPPLVEPLMDRGGAYPLLDCVYEQSTNTIAIHMCALDDVQRIETGIAILQGTRLLAVSDTEMVFISKSGLGRVFRGGSIN